MRRRLGERALRDRSQRVRLGVQLAFAVLNVWLGAQFAAWVAAVESGGAVTVARPAGIDGWLPIAGLMNAKLWLMTGRLPEVHPAAMFLFLAFVAISLLLKKAFCGWLCPIGTLSEMLWKLGRRVTGRNVDVPRWLDLSLRAIKYLLLGFFVVTILRMPAGVIDAFMHAPYAAVADIKLLHFFRFMSTTALVVIALLFALSVAIRNFWCRYLCPYGALLGIVALASPVRVTRDPITCIDCGKCTRACPSRLPVGTLPSVKSAECTLCMTCVSVCPAEGALEAKAASCVSLSPLAAAAAMALVFFGVVLVAKVTGHWQHAIPVESIRAFLANAWH